MCPEASRHLQLHNMNHGGAIGGKWGEAFGGGEGANAKINQLKMR